MRRDRPLRRRRRSRKRPGHKKLPVRPVRHNPDQGEGPWVGLAPVGDTEKLASVGTNLVIFPVNPTNVRMAAQVYELETRLPGYLAAVKDFVQAVALFGEDYTATVFKGGLDEKVLGDLIDETVTWEWPRTKRGVKEGAPTLVLVDDALYDVDPSAAKRVLAAASRIHFDARVPFKGRPEFYYPLGLKSEWDAIQPSPNFGILSGEGILGFSSIDESSFRKQVIKLAELVERGVSPGSAGVYPAVSVGQAQEPESKMAYSLFLLASGDLESSYAITPLGVGQNQAAVGDGLLMSIIRSKMWNLSDRTWSAGSPLVFALPGPFYDKKKRELTRTFSFASHVCAPTIEYRGTTGGTDVSLSVTYGPGHKRIVGGLLTVGVDTYTITKGGLDERQGVYHFHAESGKGSYDGKYTFERDAAVEISFSGTRGRLSSLPLSRSTATKSCPSPYFQMMLAKAVSRMLSFSENNPKEVLSTLRSGALSAADSAEIDRLFAANRSLGTIARMSKVFPFLLKSIAKSGVALQPTAAGSLGGAGSPLFFMGFGSRVPKERAFPVSRRTIENALRDDFTFTVTKPHIAQAIGLTESPPSPVEESATRKEKQADRATRSSWPYRDRYHRWVAHRGGLFRVTLVSKAPGEWRYSLRYGDGTDVPHILVGQVLQREYERTAQARDQLDAVYRKSVALCSRFLLPLIRSTGDGELPGLSALPVSIRGAYCLNPQDTQQVVKCNKQVRNALAKKARLPISFYMPAESESGLSWYGDSPPIRNMPGMRRGFLYARSSGLAQVPTLLLLQRLAESSDALGKKYQKMQEELSAAEYNYTIRDVTSTYKEEGEKGTQRLEAQLFDVRGRTPRVKRSVPLTRTRTGSKFVESPVQRLVVTMYGVLNDTNIAAMKQRNEKLGGSDTNLKDAAYRQFVERPLQSEIPPYGVFFQAQLSSEQIGNVLHEYHIWAERRGASAEAKSIRLKIADHFKSALVEEQKTMTTAKSGLPRGRIGKFKFKVESGKYKNKRGYPMYARSWGKMTFDEFINELGRGDATRGLNEYSRRAALPVVSRKGQPLQSYGAPIELAEARVAHPDGGLMPILPKHEQDWVKGRGKLLVYDLSFDNDFYPLPGGDLVFNPALALRKAICDAAGITKSAGDTSTQSSLAQTWKTKEKGLEDNLPELLPAPFIITGTMQLSLPRLEELTGRRIAKALPMTNDKGLLLFSQKIPVTRGPGFGPDEEDLSELFSEASAPDGLRAGGAAAFSLKQLSEFVTQTEWSRSRKQIVPLVGTVYARPNIFLPQLVAETEAFEKNVEKAKGDDQKAAAAKGISPRTEGEVNAACYYATLAEAVSGFFGSGRLPDAVLRGRLGYSAHGGQQARAQRVAGALRSPDPSQRKFATRKGSSFSDFFGFSSKLCRTTGVCVPRLGGQRTEVVAFVKPEREFLDLESLLMELPDAKTVAQGIRSGAVSSIEVPEEAAYFVGLEEGVPYMASMGDKMFEVGVFAEGGGFELVFKPVVDEAVAPQDKMFGLMASLGIEAPVRRSAGEIADDFEDAKGREPSEKEMKLLLQREELAYMKDLRAALARLKNEAQLQYRHRMNLGLLPEQMEQAALNAEILTESEDADYYADKGADEVWAFAEDYLQDLAKPNPSRYGRKPRKARRGGRSRKRGRKARRNPLDEQALNTVLDYAAGKGDEAKARASFEHLRSINSPLLWNIDKAGLNTLFPPQGRERPDTWSARSRLTSALGPSGFDMVSRLSKIEPTTVVTADKEGTPLTAQQVTRAALEKALPFEDYNALELIMQQAELSLEEALQILEQQRDAVKRRGPQGRYTMQSSSAVCKIHRKRKLANYTPPDELLGWSEWRNSVMILMSPKGAPVPRVMSWRRGDHIDCDMVGRAPTDLTELLGKSIQSAMFWVAEKPQRRMIGNGACSIYIGRVGDPGLYKVWSPGESLNLEVVTANLQQSPYKELWRSSQRDEEEVERYYAAERELGLGHAKRGGPVIHVASPPEPQAPEDLHPRRKGRRRQKDFFDLADEE